jgi:hypothetical protein
MIPRTEQATGTERDFGGWAWLLLAIYITIYDALAMRSGKHSTMSAAFYTFSSSKLGRPSLIIFWFYLTSHLFRWIPKRYDLFRRWFG